MSVPEIDGQTIVGSGAAYEALGFDVWLRVVGVGASTETIGAREYLRFMDRLYIPVTTDRLTVNQIKVINRYRERELVRGAHLVHRDRVRDIAKVLIQTVGRGNLLEFGCGKFPLSQEVSLSLYLGVDIDDEAVQHNRRNGVPCALDVASVRSEIGTFDLCIALFVFQFEVDDASLDAIATTTQPEAVCAFNVVTKDPVIRAAAAIRLCERGMWVSGLSLERFGVHDVLFVAAREAGIGRAQHARSILANRLGQFE